MGRYSIIKEGMEVGSMDVRANGASIIVRADDNGKRRLLSSLEGVPGTVWSVENVLMVELIKPLRTPRAVLRLVSREIERKGFAVRVNVS